MQSSLWKLLTAAGIVGIGSLIVLEVQNRLPTRKSVGSSVGVQTPGNEISVTPDASVELDDAMVQLGDASAELDDAMVANHQPGSANDPSAFDKPGLGAGNPAPPADDGQYFGTTEDHTLYKDQLAEEGSPFSAAMNEPPEEAETPESVADHSVPLESTEDELTRSSEFTEPVTAFAWQAPIPEATVIPFPQEQDGSKSPAEQFPVAAASTASRVKAAEKTTIQFFSNNSGGTAALKNPKSAAATSAPTPKAAAPPVSATGPEVSPASLTSRMAAMAKPAAPVIVAAVADDRIAKSVQRTSASSADEPLMFVPEPVPDLSTPSLDGVDSFDDTPPLESPLFDEDSVPVPTQPRVLPAPNEFPSPDRPLREESDVPFFGGDNDADLPSAPASGEIAEEEAETLPFMPDDSELNELPGRPQPRISPPPEDEFPLPQFPRGRPNTDSDDLEDRSRPDPFEPDSGPSNPADGRALPLPSADDLPGRPVRTNDPDSSSGRSRPVPDGTVSEVMRPQLTIRKQAPETATVGVSHDYTIVVSNEGASSAYDVIVEDELGGAAEFVEAQPVAEFNRAVGRLSWNFRELRAGEKKKVTVRIKPSGEGTLDGVATVRFKAQVKSATIITAPKLELQLSGPEQVKVGDEVQLAYTIRNRGSGDAANVVLRSVLPPGLKHPEGGDLEYEIENLAAGDAEEIILTVVAAEPGELILVSAEVTSSGVSAAKARTEIEVVGAQLALERLGPERRYVGRPAKYQNIVTNESKFEAVNAIVVEEVPLGMRFVSASNGGGYNRDTRRIRWTIPRLGAGKQAVLDVELVAEEAGEMETMVEVTENAGFRTPLTENTVVTVEDIHNVTADISRQDEPVAIGERFGFTVTIDNRGTAVARNIELSVQVPRELKILAAGTRDVPGKLFPGNLVRYAKVPEIQPNGQMTFQLTLQGESPARNARVQAFLKCDEMTEALIVSESVTVFDDQP